MYMYIINYIFFPVQYGFFPYDPLPPPPPPPPPKKKLQQKPTASSSLRNIHFYV